MSGGFVLVKNLQDLQPYLQEPLIQAMDVTQLDRHQPDEHWLYVDSQDKPQACCSLWWNDVPCYENQRLGVIGHYNSNDAIAAGQLLRFATERLREYGYTLAVGPMDGNTWRRYRLVSETGNEPPYFLEPNNPIEWLQHWQDAGFMPMAEYCSALNTDLSQSDPRLKRAWKRLQQQGVTIRHLDLNQFENELIRIYELSVKSFVFNFLYAPISQAEFLAQYLQVKPYINEGLVLMAEIGEQLVGFLFALPDLLQAQRGEAINTIIIKTIAVLPQRASAGLGSVLVEKVQHIAHESGYTRAIHALMHDANKSRNISSHYATIMRRYVLLQKPLT